MQDAAPRRHQHPERGSSAEVEVARPFPDQESISRALEAGEVGLWSWDLKSDAVTWTGHLAEIHRIESDDLSGPFSAFQRVIHPEDQPEVMSAIQEGLRTHKPCHAVYRLAPRDQQEERWIEVTASVVDENGKPGRMVGICRDVTDRQVGSPGTELEFAL